MISVPGYKQLELVHRGSLSLVYSGTRSNDNRPVILRQLRPELTTPELVSRHQREYQLLTSVDSDFVIRPIELIESGEAPILVTERPDGRPLIEFIEAGGLDIVEAARIGRKIASAINDLHGYNIIHKDINPANIVYDIVSGNIKLIEFGISTALALTHVKPEANRTFEGTLAYLSPEQTGRMNRTVDFRSDFYSLGVTLYHLISGQLPFESNDSLELIYQHMALNPKPPDQINPRVPKALTRITLKLMSKLPEDRYQSAVSIIQDLDHFLDLAAKEATDVDFEVALDDIPEQLNISERLLERDKQITNLLSWLDEVSAGRSRTVICVGEAGAGKSTLIHELEKETIARGGFVARGTHNPVTAEVPYPAVSAALNDLARLLISQRDFPARKEAISRSLTGVEEPLLSLAPELAYMLDRHPSVSERPVVEVKSRLVRGIVSFLSAVCGDDRPLVISLDNLQWVDSASIELFEDLFGNNQLPNVMLIGAYRSFALNQTNPNRVQIGRLLENNPDIQLMRVENLSTAAVNRMISESLFRSEDETREFAKLVEEKTGGNPLAIREFLTRLYGRGMISFDRRHREWVWDTTGASSQPPSENVSLSLVHQLQLLDSDTARLLQIAACIGMEFELELVQTVSGLSLADTASRLSSAIQQGYLLQTRSEDVLRDQRTLFRFAHEHVQQTAYSMIESTDRRLIHASIGEAILRVARDNIDSRIFDIVGQLNSSFDVPADSQTDQQEIAQLNIRAGRKARNTAAFRQAFKYYRTAIALLGQNAWVQYEHSLETHLEAASAAYFCGDEKQLDLLTGSIIDHARHPIDRARAMEIRISARISTFRHDEAMEIAETALKELGIRLTGATSPKTLMTAIRVLVDMRRLSQQEEVSLPPMQDERYLAAMKLLMVMSQAAYSSGDRRISRIVLEMAYLSLRHGIAPQSSFAFPAMASVLISYLGTIDLGYRLGRLAINNLTDDDRELACRTLTLAHNFNLSWKDHLNATLEPLARAYRLGMETQDIDFALVAAVSSSANAFVLGNDLGSIETNLIEHTAEARRHQQIPMYYMGAVYLQAVRNLLYMNESPWILTGPDFDEGDLLACQEPRADDTVLANLFITKLYLALVFGENERAQQFADRAQQYINAVEATPAIPFFRFLDALVCIRSLTAARGTRSIRLRLRIYRNLRLLRKWAHHAPMNIRHKYELIKAELAAADSQDLNAIEHYERAISGADQSGYLNDLALAAELAGRFQEARGRIELAQHYIALAAGSYRRWGADAKVRNLYNAFPRLAEQPDAATSTPGFVYGADRNLLDLETVTRASQVLAGEILMENLLERLMQVALINAGGHKASLILNTDDVLSVEITTWMQEDEVRHRIQSQPIENTVDVPVSVIHYVARTGEDLVLNQAAREDIFTQDEYILREKPQSIICVPIQSQSHLTGILYIENSTSTNAFTQDRVSVLKLLASQSAIALENSRLYQQLNDSRNKYQSLYENAVEGIFEVDDGGKLTTINPAALSLLGYESEAELKKDTGSELSDFFLEPADFDTIRKRLVESGRVLDFETQILKRSGEAIWIAISCQIVENEPANQFVLEGAFVDITERKRREEAEQARLIAEAATETKSEFLANMSHEIRTPMNAIIGYTNLTLSTDLSPEQHENLETIRNASSHLLRVVNDILDLSRVESGKLELEHSPFQLSTVFEDLDNLFGLAAEQKGLKLYLPDVESLSDSAYLGDPVRIGQVLINLVGNAIKFTEQGWVEVRWSADDVSNDRTRITFRVKDTGRGIEESELESVFESFSQGNTTPSDTGTGLGLSISRKLAGMMDGQLTADSKPGRGSTFYFSAMVDRLPDAIGTTSRRQSSVPGSLPESDVLLVEDNEINQKLATRLLESMGMIVTVAYDGFEALEHLEQRYYPIILMDIRMPNMDGLETIRRIRSNPALKSAVVIALSAGVLENEVDEALRAGFDHYLTKPIEPGNMYNILSEVLVGEPGSKTARPVPPGMLLRGIDFSHAIENHGGDVQFLLTLTVDFIEIYGAADQDLRRHIDQGNLEPAERLAHNLAGLSGIFGATALMESARSLETELMQTSTVSDEGFSQFQAELENFVCAIREFQDRNQLSG